MNRIAATLLVLSALAGCSSRHVTNTPRSAIEQLLLSGAVDLALEKLDMPEVKGKKVYVDLSNLKAYDVEYIRVAARARFAQLGARLVEKSDDADIIAEIASGGLGIEYKSALVGLPSIPVPNTPIPTPDLPAYRSVEQTGIFKLLIFVHQKGKLLAASQYYAKCDRDESFALWYRFQRADQIRQGWQKADLKAESKTRPELATKRRLGPEPPETGRMAGPDLWPDDVAREP